MLLRKLLSSAAIRRVRKSSFGTNTLSKPNSTASTIRDPIQFPSVQPARVNWRLLRSISCADDEQNIGRRQGDVPAMSVCDLCLLST
jgi:hypothetical protein